MSEEKQTHSEPRPERFGVVTKENFERVLTELMRQGTLSLDTETSGLRPYHGDQFFSIIIGGARGAWYFDFPEKEGDALTPHHLERLSFYVLMDPGITWFLHNAKFDLAMLGQRGLELAGDVHCTWAMARLEYNDHLTYSLEACAERIGLKKDDAVKAYLKEHKLYEKVAVPGKKQKKTRFFFDQVPHDLMVKYACTDAEVTYRLGLHQCLFFAKHKEYVRKTYPMAENCPDIWQVVFQERALTKVLHRMERRGLKVDLEFCKAAAAHEQNRAACAAQFFELATGEEFSPSGKLFERVFEGDRARWKFTEKGNPSFESEALKAFTHPAAKCVLQYRDAKSREDFYQGFLYHADKDGVVHPQLHQAGTGTGRMASSEPNFQNVTSEEEAAHPRFVVRRAIIPRENYRLVAIDYKAMEFRVMLDYAGEEALAQKIMGGLDPHEATAELAGITRKAAKTLNFGLLYGMGNQRLAEALGIPLPEAQKLKAKYFGALPRVERLISAVSATATRRGMIFNPFGRVSHFPDPRFAYKATNYLVQGTCADVMKKALVDIEEFLTGKRSRLLFSVHDEALLEIHENEFTLIEDVKKLMERAFTPRILPLECSVEWSAESWADLKPWEG